MKKSISSLFIFLIIIFAGCDNPPATEPEEYDFPDFKTGYCRIDSITALFSCKKTENGKDSFSYDTAYWSCHIPIFEDGDKIINYKGCCDFFLQKYQIKRMIFNDTIGLNQNICIWIRYSTGQIAFCSERDYCFSFEDSCYFEQFYISTIYAPFVLTGDTLKTLELSLPGNAIEQMMKLSLSQSRTVEGAGKESRYSRTMDMIVDYSDAKMEIYLKE